MKKVWVAALFVGCVALLAALLWMFEGVRVSGRGMTPTIPNGKMVWVNKRFFEVSRGDVVLVKPADCVERQECEFVKRVIGLPGDEVMLEGGRAFVNGNKLVENYLAPGTETAEGAYLRDGEAVILGENEYVVLGDGREYSADSRAWGPVEKSGILGVAVFLN